MISCGPNTNKRFSEGRFYYTLTTFAFAIKFILNQFIYMGKVLIIGAGGVGTVVAHKVAQNPEVSFLESLKRWSFC